MGADTSSGRPTPADSAATRQVRDFYARYVPAVFAPGSSEPAWVRVIAERPALFGPALLGALRADAAAKRAAGGELTGLDVDPFLASQDPCEQYATGAARRERSRYVVDVHDVCAGERSPDAAVAIVLEPAGGSWRIVNVRYPREGSDLMTALRDASTSGTPRP